MGYLVDVDDAMGLLHSPARSLSLSLSSRLSRQCKVIAVTRAATVIRAREGVGEPFKEFATLFRPTLIAEEDGDEGRSLLQEGMHAFLKRV